MAWLLKAPPAQFGHRQGEPIRPRTAHPAEVLRSHGSSMWLYLMFVLIASGGLTMGRIDAPIAKDLKIERSR